MKKVFSSHSELAHIWAQQKQNEGKSSNMFFEGTRIFSYGYHYCIANFVKPNIVLINSRGYSVSTAKHHNHVSRALSTNIKRFTVPSVGWSKYDYQNEIEHNENIAYFWDKINSNLELAKKATKTTNWLIQNAISFHSELLDYCRVFCLQIPDSLVISADLLERAKKQEQKEIERKKKEEQFREKQNQILINYCLPAWLNNENTFDYDGETYSTEKINNLENCYLRLRGENVYTSKGANVPLRAAKILFDLINSGKDVKGHEIGNYTVIGLNGVLTIGCHKIDRKEINRFASLMQWGQISE